MGTILPCALVRPKVVPSINPPEFIVFQTGSPGLHGAAGHFQQGPSVELVCRHQFPLISRVVHTGHHLLDGMLKGSHPPMALVDPVPLRVGKVLHLFTCDMLSPSLLVLC